MKQNRFPPGWDEERVQKVLLHYGEQTENEAVAEDEAAFEDQTQTVMEVPTALVLRSANSWQGIAIRLEVGHTAVSSRVNPGQVDRVDIPAGRRRDQQL
jgi:hypothetical protein